MLGGTAPVNRHTGPVVAIRSASAIRLPPSRGWSFAGAHSQLKHGQGSELPDRKGDSDPHRRANVSAATRRTLQCPSHLASHPTSTRSPSLSRFIRPGISQRRLRAVHRLALSLAALFGLLFRCESRGDRYRARQGALCRAASHPGASDRGLRCPWEGARAERLKAGRRNWRRCPPTRARRAAKSAEPSVRAIGVGHRPAQRLAQFDLQLWNYCPFATGDENVHIQRACFRLRRNQPSIGDLRHATLPQNRDPPPRRQRTANPRPRTSGHPLRSPRRLRRRRRRPK